MSKIPDWALKYKRKGTEIRYINGHYYLYEITSRYDKKKKRAVKVTLGILGKITPGGFVESEKRKLKKQALQPQDVSIKEYGLSSFIMSHLSAYVELLKKHFPKHYRFIIASALVRLAYQSPIKKYQYYYAQSYLSELFGSVGLSANSVSKKLREIGGQRQAIVEFFREFNIDNDHIIFDGTDMFSQSGKLRFAKKSKTKQGTYDNIINLLFVFSSKLRLPLYYRILSGDIKDVKAFKNSLDELGIKEGIVIGDKGFYSRGNVEKLDILGLNYILPLRRSSKLIDYGIIASGDLSNYDGYFRYQGRVIWYYEREVGGKRVVVYRDETLRNEEIVDYLARVETHPEEYDKESFFKKQYIFGTIALYSNVKDQSAESLYNTYKSRSSIEKMFDIFKNLYEGDKSYMQDEVALEGWMFINYIVMHWYYRIYVLLKDLGLLKKYSVQDIIVFLRDIKKVKINGRWHEDELTKKNKLLFEKLKIHIT